jgi:type IV pilus assembly protein PilC
MLTFSYTARDQATNKKVSSTLQAESQSAAAKLLLSHNMIPLEVHAETEQTGILGALTNRSSTKDRVIFTRQLATLINAGLPLTQSLHTVQAQTKNKHLQNIAQDVITRVEGGSSLADAFKRHPKEFNELFIALVAAGEVSGTLDTSLERVANQQEKDAEIMAKIKGAMMYPIIVLLVMFAVVIFMMMTLLPQVEMLYADTGQTLPTLTQVLLTIVNIIKKFWYLVPVPLALGVFFAGKWIQSGPGKRVMDRIKMRAPIVGPLFMKMYMARFARTGSTLIASGVPLLQVLEISARAVNNVHIGGSIKRAAEKVKGGKSLAKTLEGDPNFLDLVPQMLSIGEQSGATEKMMGKTADYFEKEVDDQIKAISTIIEPLMMVIMGGVALVIVGAVLLPVYTLSGEALAG